MQSNQIRSAFIDYFARNGHQVVPSSSLIPYGDKTILFTNAGMNQFKNLFLGLEKRDYTRATTAQKVMRVSGKHNDLEQVGPSQRHHTFFEMLGNFSFGDYFKADAMHYALELVTQVYRIEMDRLWFTVYQDDDEAETLWKKLGVAPARIIRFGAKENFWQMGETGPCGPNSEIHCFAGNRKNDNTADHVNADQDETIVELWNLVFMQYDRDNSGHLTSLPRRSIDTGMGFERVCRILQGVPSNYETDLFVPIFDRIQSLAGHNLDQRLTDYVAYRVIADHSRAATFLIADGVLPGNEGRNYVLRMILRRAARFGRKLGLNEPFLSHVADSVIDKMGAHYTELTERRIHILNTIQQEEERFARTLDLGLQRLDEVIVDGQRAAGSSPSFIIPGDLAFKLYDTYGLPFEITRDEAKERGVGIDEEGYLVAREEARGRNRGGGRFNADYDLRRSYGEVLDTLKTAQSLPASGVNHDPYGSLTMPSRVVAVLRDGEMTEYAVPGERIEIVLPQTPFYVESGGQVSDTGTIIAQEQRAGQPVWRMIVHDMYRPAPGLIVHACSIEYGQPTVGDACLAQVDVARRHDIMRNHSATHLLQKSLRAIIGTHVSQQGSLVAPDRLRFDFSHNAPLTREQREQVSQMLNDAILANYAVTIKQTPYADAIKSGAMAFFSEKYGDVVRVVSIGNNDEVPFSLELCGGTHVQHTGDIGSAIIAEETAVASGVRRIEALTGRGALAYVQHQADQFTEVVRILGTTPDQATEQAARLVSNLSETQKSLERAQKDLARFHFDELLATEQPVNGVPILVARAQVQSIDTLREMTDWFRERHASGVAVLGAILNEKPVIVVAVSKDLNARGLDAGKLAREVATIVGGSGGGRPVLAQAGGKEPGKLDAALAEARRLIMDRLKV